MANIQDIFTSLKDRKLIDHNKLSFKQNKVISDIIKCKTIKAGMNKDVCENCGEMQTHYNSCKNPNCPMCQGINRALWIDKQKYYSLNIPYYHIVFTLPDTLNQLCLISPNFMYGLLFECASKSLSELASDSKYLGGKIGFTCVLHTWGQNLHLHPHLHCIVTSGGIDSNDKWVESKRKDFLFPVKVISALFKGKYLALLKQRYVPNDSVVFQKLIDEAYEKEWIVYIKEPLKNPNSVIEYLGRYTHRIAISNARIVSYKDNKVSFKYKDYKDNNKLKIMTLDDTEFFRRYMMHILPKGFSHIRHYGLLASANKTERFINLRIITNTEPKACAYIRDPIKILNEIFKRDIRICRHCGQYRHPLLE